MFAGCPFNFNPGLLSQEASISNNCTYPKMVWLKPGTILYVCISGLKAGVTLFEAIASLYTKLITIA